MISIQQLVREFIPYNMYVAFSYYLVLGIILALQGISTSIPCRDLIRHTKLEIVICVHIHTLISHNNLLQNSLHSVGLLHNFKFVVFKFFTIN